MKHNIRYSALRSIQFLLIGLLIIPLFQTTAFTQYEDDKSNLTNLVEDFINPDADETKEKVYNQLTANMNPKEVAFPLSPSEFSNISNVIEEELYQSWMDQPKYSYSENNIAGWNVVNIETPEEAVSIRKATIDGNNITQKTIFSQRPLPKLLEFDESVFDNITVPVIPASERMGEAEPEYIQKTIRFNFGYEIPSVHFKEVLSIDAILVKFDFWVEYDSVFHLLFPVDAIIEYPAQIMEGHAYDLRCTLIPINDPNMNEFEFRFHFEVGYSIDVMYWVSLDCDTCCCVFWVIPYSCNCRWTRHWKRLTGGSWGFDYHLKSDYKTPLGDDSASFNLPAIDLLQYLPYIRLISDYVSLDISLGTAKLYGNSITALMTVFPLVLDTRLLSWTETNQEQAINFCFKDQMDEPEAKFSVYTLTYWIDRVEFYPTIYLGFDNANVLGWNVPLRDWFGGFTWNLPKIPIKFLPFPLTSKESYFSKAVSLDYDALYDFNMDIEQTYTGDSVFGPIQKYKIELANPNLTPQQNDIIHLEVSGLPEGYRADFDMSSNEYQISGAGEETIQKEGLIVSFPDNFIINANPDPFGMNGQSTATLTIFGPIDPTDAPPGPHSFDIIATSKQRESHNLPNPSITQSMTLDIPETIGVDLNFANIYNGKQVLPGEYFPIEFYGQNEGNMNDTINVTATIKTEQDNRTWSVMFPVEQYGTGDHYYSGEFGFTYSREDFFPFPGMYILEISASSKRTPFIDVEKQVFLNFTNAYGVEGSITPEETVVFANWETNFTLRFNNTGNTWDNFTIESGGWDNYLSFPQRITNVTPMLTQEVPITLKIPNPDIITNDTYKFRIILKSEADLNTFIVKEVNVTILAPDYIPPAIIPLDPAQKPLIYPKSPLTLGPSWEAVDKYPGIYRIFINGSMDFSGSWSEGSPIQAPVTGSNPLDPGLYNVTIEIGDTSSNFANKQVWVTIVPQDTVTPNIVSIPGETEFPVNFIRPQYLYWNCSEEFVYNITVYQNGTPQTLIYGYNMCAKPIAENHSNFTFRYTLLPSSLLEGVYNITFAIQDMSNNIEQNTVIITITSPDGNNPGISDPPDVTAYLGHNEILSITATDSYPEIYELWAGTTLLKEGTWYSGVPLEFFVDDLDILVGDNDLELYLYDHADNFALQQWVFTLLDIDKPLLLIEPSNLVLYEHNYTQLESPFWSVYDLDSQPGTYTIDINGVTVEEGAWIKGNGTFELPMNNLIAGTYHYDAYFRDATGNTEHSELDLIILDIIEPIVMCIEEIYFEPLYTPDWFEYFIYELHPSHYSLYRNGSLVTDITLSTEFPYVFVSISNLLKGVYNFTLIVEDESGNFGSQTVIVKVADFTPPLIIQPPDIVISEGAEGFLTWEINEANPKNYTLYRNGASIDSGPLDFSNLTLPLKNLELGEYTFTLFVCDEFGLSHTATSLVTVVDITPPACPHISDCQYELGDENAELIWNARDLHPATYQVNVNNSLAEEMPWDGNDIVLHLLGWASGTYRVEIFIKDTSGNIATDEVIVRIIEEETVSEGGSGFEIIVILTAIALILGKRKRISNHKSG